jgi:cysteine desulfurase
VTDARIYFDHAATTPLEPEALEAMLPWLTTHYASASTRYTPGRQAARAVEEAREHVARLIGAAPEEIFFTSGGTEANNWAIRGAVAARARSDGRILASAIEHHSVLSPVTRWSARDMKRNGWRWMERGRFSSTR